MRKSRQFWQDVDLAICSLMLRQVLQQVIIEGHNSRQSFWEINNVTASMPVRDRVLHRYHEVRIARFRNYNDHMHV